MRTKAIFSLGVTLLVALCAGCVSHESGKPVLAGAGAPGARPRDPYYARPWNKPCPVDAVFSGYHATCWTPWPEYWTGCPPPAVGVEIPAVATGDSTTDEPPFAPTPSVFDQIEPPAPPLSELTEPDAASPPDADALGPEVITKQESSPFLEEALLQTDETPRSSETREGEGQPPEPSLGESDESHGGAQPERDLASPPATTSDTSATGTGEKDSTDSQGSMPPAPLPKDTLSLFTLSADAKLPAVPDERLAEGDRDNVEASEKDSPGWAFCSDDAVADTVETSGQTGRIRSDLSRNSTSLSALLHSLAL
ncbi:MAG: hypothetical protein ABIP48_08530 [Planctomycetota bacterium]